MIMADSDLTTIRQSTDVELGMMWMGLNTSIKGGDLVGEELADQKRKIHLVELEIERRELMAKEPKLNMAFMREHTLGQDSLPAAAVAEALDLYEGEGEVEVTRVSEKLGAYLLSRGEQVVNGVYVGLPDHSVWYATGLESMVKLLCEACDSQCGGTVQ